MQTFQNPHPSLNRRSMSTYVGKNVKPKNANLNEKVKFFLGFVVFFYNRAVRP